MKKNFLSIYFLFSTFLFAHPHIFFEASFVANIKEDNFQDIKINLILDELNTLLFIGDFEPNDYGDVKQTNIPFYSELKKHIHLTYNQKEIKNLIFDNARIEDENFVINLRIPINNVINKNDKIIFSVYDKKYYYTYDYSKKNLKKNLMSSKYDFNIIFEKNKKKPFYYGLVYPEEYEVNFIEK